MRIYILFDRKDEDNDKKWLLDQLYLLNDRDVISVSINHNLFRLERKGFVYRIYSHLIMLYQSFRAIKKAKNEDAIIAWRFYSGIYSYIILRLLRKRIKLVCMNWLTPLKSDKKWARIEKRIALDNNSYIIVNSPDSPTNWKSFLHLSTTDNFHVIADVYDDSIKFREPNMSRQMKYIFTGGMNNRNWKLVCELAFVFPNEKFICVALEDDFRKQVTNIPNNVQVFFETTSEQYYSLMEKSYAVMMPLLDSRVAGLINITRSAQAGVPCMITKTEATKQYYYSEDLLVGSDLEWKPKLEWLLGLNEQRYVEVASNFQNYVMKEKSPQRAAEHIYSLIEEDSR